MCGVLIWQTRKLTEEDKADGLFLQQQQCSAEMWFTSAVQLALQKTATTLLSLCGGRMFS